MTGDYSRIRAFVQALAALGVRHASISPGSRSTPLALTVARNPDITHWIHHDERSAAFFALGVGRQTGIPAAVITTSGTATAELYPAVIEARFGRVPLLLLTADRPPELRGTGANQTIDQIGLYGNNVKMFADKDPPDPAAAAEGAAGAVSASLEPPAGPVHINFPFREPLMPGDEVPAAATSPTVERAAPTHLEEGHRFIVDSIIERVAGRRTVWIAGPDPAAGFGQAIGELAAATGLPVLADPLSNARRYRGCIATGDALAQSGVLDRLEPEVVVRLGPVPTSKALNQWIETGSFEYLICDASGWRDPAGRADPVLAAEAADIAAALAREAWPPPPDGWTESWLDADERARAALERVLDAVPFPSEPGVMAAAVSAPAETLWVASSMPVRDLDLILGHGGPARILANRGASGIDGFLSSAMGSAAATGRRTLAVTGDLSFLYDVTALATAARYRLPITILAINNDGGGIFEMLPQRDLPEFEELFATPHGLDLGAIAASFGVEHQRPTSKDELTELLFLDGDHPRVIEVKTNRSQLAAVRERLLEAVREALK